jgi:hypothetical protein
MHIPTSTRQACTVQFGCNCNRIKRTYSYCAQHLVGVHVVCDLSEWSTPCCFQASHFLASTGADHKDGRSTSIIRDYGTVKLAIPTHLVFLASQCDVVDS